MGGALIVWRHPRPVGVEGRCIGRIDVAVDQRRAKRLAHRIRARARAEGWARIVVTSPLRRCAAVGQWLARWGWRHRVDARLIELDFGDWDGRPWTSIAPAELAAWTDDFSDHHPGGGESVRELMARCAAWLEELGGHEGTGARPCCVVGHAGWINAARWVAAGRAQPGSAADWPRVLGYGEAESFASSSGGAESQ